MTDLFVQNKKIKNSGLDTYLVYNYGIPAYKSAIGMVTCPFAGDCGKKGGCYALQGPYMWTPVARAYEFRLQASLSDEFEDLAQKELDKIRRRAKKLGKKVAIRIHDSGDYYNLIYIRKVFNIINNNPDILFYSYTKAVKIFKNIKDVPANLTIVFSEGGTQDKYIDTNKDRHSRVFSSKAALVAAGYDDCTEDDTVAFRSTTGKVGLVYHGYAAKAWTTNTAG